MSVLKIIALLGVLVGCISLICELRHKGKQSFSIIIMLLIASALLFVFSGMAQDRMISRQAMASQLDPADPPKSDAVETSQGGTANGSNAQNAENPHKDTPPAQADESDGIPEIGDIAMQEDDDILEIGGVVIADTAKKDAQTANDAPQPNAPIADAGNDIDGIKLQETVNFSARKSKKGVKGAEITTYAWEFGDGTAAKGRDVRHAYEKAGVYEAVLTVTDKNGISAKATRRVSVDRPKSKVKFFNRRLDNVSDAASSPNSITGTIQKAYDGSSVTVEVSGYMLSTDGCTCEMAVALQGQGCNTVRKKEVSNTGEGNVNVKAVCKGAPGEFVWNFERKASGTCGCTWKDIKLEGFEY